VPALLWRPARCDTSEAVSTIRLLIGDDHTLVRQGLRKILEERPAWQVVAEVGNGRDAIRECATLDPDVAILDIGMPVLNGIDAARQIARDAPRTRVVILSMHAEEAYVTRALHAGASGYLLKDSAGTELLTAVDAVAQGELFFSAPITRLMLDDYIRRVRDSEVVDRFDTLSTRERQIFQLIAEARTNKEVAAILDISAATVETHRARILQKLDIHNAAELVLYAARRGVVS
jgi:two-component system, NarL family, response regulator NreC